MPPGRKLSIWAQPYPGAQTSPHLLGHGGETRCLVLCSDSPGLDPRPQAGADGVPLERLGNSWMPKTIQVYVPCTGKPVSTVLA